MFVVKNVVNFVAKSIPFNLINGALMNVVNSGLSIGAYDDKLEDNAYGVKAVDIVVDRSET